MYFLCLTSVLVYFCLFCLRGITPEQHLYINRIKSMRASQHIGFLSEDRFMC